MSRQDLTGQEFGYWTVIEKHGMDTKKQHTEYLCRCGLCNGLYVIRADNLIQGRTSKCACCGIHWKKHRRMFKEDEQGI